MSRLEGQVPNASFRAVLTNPNFLALWLAQIFSQLADKVILVYLIVLLASYGFSDSSDISRLTIVFTVPAVLFGSIAGVYVDRWQKKELMIGSNVLRGGLVLVLPLAAWFGGYSSAWIYAVTFLLSTVTQFFAPAELAMIPTLVQKRNLLAANSLFTSTMMASMVLGLGLGDPLLRLVGDQYGHWAIAAMYLLSGGFLLFVQLKYQPSPIRSSTSVWLELKEGFRYLLSQLQIVLWLLRMILVFSAFAALTILVIGFIKDVLYLEQRFFGYFLAVAGLGMGVSAGLIGRYGAQWGKERLIRAGFVGMSSILFLLANLKMISFAVGIRTVAAGYSLSEVWIAFLLSFCLGLFAAAIAVPIQTRLQEEIPEHMRGKVFGVQNMLINTAMTLPMALAGGLADALELRFPGFGIIYVMNLLALILVSGIFLSSERFKAA